MPCYVNSHSQAHSRVGRPAIKTTDHWSLDEAVPARRRRPAIIPLNYTALYEATSVAMVKTMHYSHSANQSANQSNRITIFNAAKITGVITKSTEA